MYNTYFGIKKNKDKRVLNAFEREDDTLYDLVLFTTDEGWTERINNKSRIWKSMADAYSKAYSFKAIIFTHTPQLINRFSHSSVKVITDFELTSIGVPTITGLYYAAYKTYNALYYGYVNADILLNYSVFDALQYLQSQVRQRIIYPQVRQRIIYPQHELAGRVYEKDYSEIPYVFDSLKHVKQFFNTVVVTRRTLRNAGSAVSVCSLI